MPANVAGRYRISLAIYRGHGPLLQANQAFNSGRISDATDIPNSGLHGAFDDFLLRTLRFFSGPEAETLTTGFRQ